MSGGKRGVRLAGSKGVLVSLAILFGGQHASTSAFGVYCAKGAFSFFVFFSFHLLVMFLSPISLSVFPFAIPPFLCLFLLSWFVVLCVCVCVFHPPYVKYVCRRVVTFCTKLLLRKRSVVSSSSWRPSRQKQMHLYKLTPQSANRWMAASGRAVIDDPS